MLTIKEWAEDDRPREKLQSKGREMLSDAELLAIIIGSGSQTETAVSLSKQILNESQNSLNQLGRKSIQELTKIKGIGPAKAISIIAALELGRRHKISEVVQKNEIKSSKDAYSLFYPLLSDKMSEEFWVAYLNNANKVICKERLSIGGLNSTIVDVRIILKKALENLATAIVLCHNHPSGNLKPSSEDIKITSKVKEAAKLFDCKVIDHIIISDDVYFSFADESML